MEISEILKGWFGANIRYWKDLQDQKKINDQVKVDPLDLYERVHMDSAPVFVLSTGRVGTKLLTELLQKSKEVVVEHHPSPEPSWHANWAYHNSQSNLEIVKGTVDGMRYEKIRDAFLIGKLYIETNNRITFFAKALAELYPKAKFIHLYRHPEKFVASGLGRKWYQGVITDEGRLMPSMPEMSTWKNYSLAVKIGWLWNETNSFIEDFKATMPEERILTIKAENLFQNASIGQSIIDFCGISDIDETLIIEAISRPVNQQHKSKRTQLSKEDIDGLNEFALLKSKYY